MYSLRNDRQAEPRVDIMKITGKIFATVVIALAAASAHALPALQLDIKGGTYDSTTQTIRSSGNTFELYAYGLTSKVSIADTFFVSMALLPPSSFGGSFGSFKVNGTTINVTADMIYGTPPLEGVLASTDPGDLSPHGIFPTWFYEQSFNFSGQSGMYNTQTSTGLGNQPGTGMYYAKFDIDISGLSAGMGIHFDLYNEKLLTGGDIDINKFAPFSHDAEGWVSSPIPEPETYAMLLAGLGLLGFAARRRKSRLAE